MAGINKYRLTVAGKDWLTGTRMSPGGTSSPNRATGCRGDMMGEGSVM